jgi:hypothetical protein
LIAADQPLNPNVFRPLLLPNFTRRVGVPLEVGVGAVEEATVTVADWLAEPPDPVHVSVNAVVAVRFPVL